jgi:hypothetical protein
VAKLLPNLRARYFDSDGDPLAGGKLHSYIAGTDTPLTTYTDEAGDTSNTNPVILDANGEADVWLGNRSYKFILTDADDVVQWTVDDIDGSETDVNPTSPWAEHAITDGQSAANLSGETLDFDDYSSAVYDVEIKRGTTVFVNGVLTIQDFNGTGRVLLGGMITEELHGVTFSLSQVATVVQLRAAADSGAGNGTIKLSRRLVPV